MDMETALIALRVARSFWMEKISRLRMAKMRLRKGISHPKYLTNRTAWRTLASETRWSVILLIPILRVKRPEWPWPAWAWQ